jgi:hypothetical protein
MRLRICGLSDEDDEFCALLSCGRGVMGLVIFLPLGMSRSEAGAHNFNRVVTASISEPGKLRIRITARRMPRTFAGSSADYSRGII